MAPAMPRAPRPQMRQRDDLRGMLPPRPKPISSPINPDNFPRGLPGSYGDMDCPALNEEVLLADNKWIPAQDLKVGDKVATHLGSNKVTHIDVLKDRVKKEVVFSDNEKEESIVTSDSHPYYVQNEEGFVEVKDLKVGDQVGNFKVKEIKDADKGSVVHISIDEAQTYYLKAGDKKVLSHNKSIRQPEEQTIEGIPISQLPPRPFDPLFDPPRNKPRPKIPRKPRKPFPRGRGRSIRDLLEFLKQRSRERFPNPTIFGQPMPRDMDFSQMPKISPEDMLNLQVPTRMPVMPDERMAPPMMGNMEYIPEMEQISPEPFASRPGFAGGTEVDITDFLNSDPRQQMFGIETRIGVLENQLQEALANNDRQAYDMIVDQINDADAQRIDIMNSMNPTPTIDDILSDLEKKN